MQSMISSPYLSTTLLFDLSQRWSQYLDRCMAASVSESLDVLGCYVAFLMEPILAELDQGQYVGPILPNSLLGIVSKTSG